MVCLLLDVPLSTKDFSFSTRNLLAEGGDLGLTIVVGSRLFIQVESSIVALFLEAAESHRVGVVSGLEVVVLQHFLILKVTELSLYRVQLVPQREVVLVALLDLEDLGFELRN